MPRAGSIKTEMDSTDELINKVCTNFANKLESKIDKKLDKLESKLDAKLNDINNSIKDLNKIASSNVKSIKMVEQKCEFIEQYMKRNALRIVGFPENAEGNILNDVLTFFENKLNISCGTSDIDCVFRVGKFRENTSPRPVLIQFVSNIKKQEVYLAKKMLKDSVIAIYEDLTVTRYNLLSAAKKKFGKKNAWSSGGKIFVWSVEEKKSCLISSEADL